MRHAGPPAPPWPPEGFDLSRPAEPFLRESHFFVAHPPDRIGDALVLTAAHQPSRRLLDSYTMATIGGRESFHRQSAPAPAAGDGLTIGTARIGVDEPYRRLSLRCGSPAPVEAELTFTARTRPYLLREGHLRTGGRTVWRQRQMIQSGWFDGWYRFEGRRHRIERWWGQRDHSWGVRDHLRVPCWIWLAAQLPDGMLGFWCFEQADGSRAYTDGAWIPAGDHPPVPVVAVTHDLAWLSGLGTPAGYGETGSDVHGLRGVLTAELADGSAVTAQGSGPWLARYGRRGGGLFRFAVTTDDGRHGTGVLEVTGRRHHRYFPSATTQVTARLGEDG
jgi:hypothetical protein